MDENVPLVKVEMCRIKISLTISFSGEGLREQVVESESVM